MTANKKWIRIFQIPDHKTHPAGHTIYQVTCSTFPVENPEEATTVSTWKRFSQLSSLHKVLSTVHKQLYLHGTFPGIPETGYFNRKRPEVVESRKVWALELLEFLATQPILNSHPVFTNFLFDLEDPGDTSSEGSYDRSPLGGPPRTRSPPGDLPEPGSAPGSPLQPTTLARARTEPDLQVHVTASLSLDTTPVLTPTMAEPSPREVVEEEKVERVEQEQDEEESVANICALVAEMPESDIPPYIAEAAELISEALRFEAEEMFEASLGAYRSAIGKLLSSVQSDPDVSRQAQVKRRIAQYISKAEQIVKLQSELKTKRSSRRSLGIPHLQLFGQLADLKNYRVKSVLAGKIILAEDSTSGQLVIFKTLHKAPAVYKKTKTSLLPINITYMVRLLKYFETDDCVYLMLEYCPAGRLWDVVSPLVKQQELGLAGGEVSTEEVTIDTLEGGRDRCHTPVKRQTSILRPSESFIRDRQESVQLTEELSEELASFSLSEDVGGIQLSYDTSGIQLSEDTGGVNLSEDEAGGSGSDSDSLGDVSVVHAQLSSLVVVDRRQIQHFEGLAEEEEEETCPRAGQGRIVRNSKAMLDTISRTLNASQSAASGSSVLERLDSLEDRIRLHLQGDLEQGQEAQEEPAPAPAPVPRPPLAPAPPPSRPPVLRKLSEMLPQCPVEDLLDSTQLPDRLIRTWAAEIAQVLSSLHYREILLKDLNPDNVLLDSRGHVKLTYQCEWVSVDSSLSRAAVRDNYCAPEVISAGDLTPAADWWSFGALLHLLYTGGPPASALPTGVDSSIPLHLPPCTPPEASSFICQLLQPSAEHRLGAGTSGTRDVRGHKYFKGWDWDKMSWR